jgi:hypothetical protein
VAGRLLPFVLLTGAAAATLPVVYALVRPDLAVAARLVALFLGLLAMGLAWAAGASLEDRRRGSVAAVCALGVVAPALAAVPVARDLVAGGMAWLLAGAALALVALALLGRRWRAAG